MAKKITAIDRARRSLLRRTEGFHQCYNYEMSDPFEVEFECKHKKPPINECILLRCPYRKEMATRQKQRLTEGYALPVNLNVEQ